MDEWILYCLNDGGVLPVPEVDMVLTSRPLEEMDVVEGGPTALDASARETDLRTGRGNISKTMGARPLALRSIYTRLDFVVNWSREEERIA